MTKVQPRRIIRYLALAAVLVGVVAVYAFYAEKSTPVVVYRNQNVEYYQLLTDAFLAGRVSLLVKPDPRLLALGDPFDPKANADFRLHDATLFHGQYFLYFGPTPALTLFLPFRLLTGRHLAGNRAVAVFSSIGFVCSCAMVLLISRKERWQVPFPVEIAILLLLGFGTFIPFLLDRPAFYEVAISAGYCFSAVGFFFLALAAHRERLALWPLAASGLFFGLSLGCRPHFIVGVLLICLIVVQSVAKRQWNLGLIVSAPVRCFITPIALVGCLLLCYNYARFHSPLEFGTTNQLTADRLGKFRLGLANAPDSVFSFLFSPPRVTNEFPYLEAVASSARLARSFDPTGFDPAVGMFVASPLTLLPLFFAAAAIAFPGFRAPFKLIQPESRCVILALAAFGGSMLLFHCLSPWVAGRYSVDFTPTLVLTSCLVVLIFSQRMSRAGMYWLITGACLAAVWSTAVNIAISYPA